MSAKEDLVLAAERLFALQGVEGVPLRQVGEEAGQRNVAAVQYHFGGRDGLIQAIFDFRLARINVHRWAMLADVREAGLLRDVRALMEVLVWPLAEQAAVPGSHYVRFLNRMCDYEGRTVVPLSYVGLNSGIEVGELLSEAVGRDNEPDFVPRNELAGRLILSGMAALEQRLAAHNWSMADGSPDYEGYADGIVDAVVAMLTAPVLRRTRARR
ncbi:TetR/AcrR family transcriptional regulator [Yinghuangia sp. ASG 101]|uniref:TetR/AcrR family transcriptional regulator n=1 Tax=Yinghuangia sp. ASG 101 TaxID=2896848 RepID=UPI001E546F85|nr:helix-turn-helix domain-containing protein [Yinghuangia sp. ASG 101]UGQ13983.1 TetR/AcrR family transcriptional regulator [Yinghuangia sp. ASG 101]